MYSVSYDKTARMWDTHTGESRREFRGSQYKLRAAAATARHLYTAGTGAGSATGVNNHSEALRIWYDKKVDFKIDTVDGSTLNTMSAAAYLPIKVGGTDYFLPLYEEM